MLTASGRRVALTIPDDPPWPELREAKAEYHRLQQELHVTRIRLTNLEDDRRRAVDGDRTRLTRAIRKGEPEPEPKATQKVDAALAGTRRRIEAVEAAVAEAEAELVAVVTAHRDGWTADAEQADAEAAAVHRDHLEAMLAARARRDEGRALLRWLRRFPDASYSVQESRLDRLPSPNGEPFIWGTVVEALRADAAG